VSTPINPPHLRPTTKNVSTAPFQFGLEQVRRVRAYAEELAKEQFAASLSERLRGLAMLHAATEQLEEARAAAVDTDAAGAAASGADLVARQAWLEHVAHSRQDAAAELAQREAEVEERRAELTTANQRREVLDRLKERRRAEHQLEEARREAAELDEMASVAHWRRREHA
jgi:flagellar protein FliJ